jgi:hypothetical protein
LHRSALSRLLSYLLRFSFIQVKQGKEKALLEESLQSFNSEKKKAISSDSVLTRNVLVSLCRSREIIGRTHEKQGGDKRWLMIVTTEEDDSAERE